MSQPTDATAPGGPQPDEFVHLLGRAVRQLRTYSADHAITEESIAACRKALVAYSAADELVIRIAAGALQVEYGRAVTTAPDPLLVTQLERARIAKLVISRDASMRDLAQFGLALLAHRSAGAPLSERLSELGITTIGLELVPRPELIDVPAPSAVHHDLLARERRRRAEQLSHITRASHMYPPDTGWVRVDPAVGRETFSLTDLAILVDDPSDLAAMLARLADEVNAPDADGRSALEQRFSDITRIFASLEPRLARMMFSRLAAVVLAMDPLPRRRLLRETVLTGLLDGAVDGRILHDFPDPTLAESLCLLLDLETAAPEVVTTALDRLGISAERRSALQPLIEAQLERRRTDTDASVASAELDRYARRLVRIDDAHALSFTDFAAFDLSFDGLAAIVTAGMSDAIAGFDGVTVRLECLSSLVRIEPNPERVADFLSSWGASMAELRQTTRWADVARHAARLRELAGALRERRPEVADEAAKALVAFCTRDVAHDLLPMHEDAGRRPEAVAVLDAVGDALTLALITLLGEPVEPAVMEALTRLMSERGSTYAPGLAAHLVAGDGRATLMIVKMLGHGGAGHENAIAAQLDDAEEALGREAVRALARIGSPAAARHLVGQLDDRPDWLRAAALEALLRLTPQVARAQAHAVLAHTDLARRYPALMRTLLDRLARLGTDGLKDVLTPMARLRFRFWNPPVARLGRRARSLLAS